MVKQNLYIRNLYLNIYIYQNSLNPQKSVRFYKIISTNIKHGPILPLLLCQYPVSIKNWGIKVSQIIR